MNNSLQGRSRLDILCDRRITAQDFAVPPHRWQCVLSHLYGAVRCVAGVFGLGGVR